MDAYAEALAAWPGIALDRETFERAVAERGEVLHGGDLLLALCCARGDARAIAHFERAFMPAIPRLIAHIAKTDLDRDEVCQRLRKKLLLSLEGRAPRIADYSGRGPLAGWLRVAAVREALNLHRTKNPESAELGLDDVDPNDGPEAAVIRARYGRALSDAFRSSVQTLSSDDRMILRLHYLDGLDIEQIGRILGVHRSTASRSLSKTRDAVLKETRRRVREQLRASESEVESVLRLAGDDLEISLHRALS